MGVTALAKHDAILRQLTGFDSLFRVIPSAAATVHYESHEDADDRSDHEHAGGCLPAEDDANQDRDDHREGTRQDHLAQGASNRDVDTRPVIWLTRPGHDAGILVKLTPDLLDHVSRRAADGAHRERGEDV